MDDQYYQQQEIKARARGKFDEAVRWQCYAAWAKNHSFMIRGIRGLLDYPSVNWTKYCFDFTELLPIKYTILSSNKKISNCDKLSDNITPKSDFLFLDARRTIVHWDRAKSL